jgi:hypothetical protein
VNRIVARWLLVMACSLAPLGLYAQEPKKDKEDAEKKGHIRVVVVVILATKDNNVVDKKLADLAKEMEKRGSEFTGFKIHSVLSESIEIGKSNSFDLLEEKTLKVAIDKPKDDKGRVGLTITPKDGTEVSYTCACEKFFPILTGHKTKDGPSVIVAVSAKPCTGKGP